MVDIKVQFQKFFRNSYLNKLKNTFVMEGCLSDNKTHKKLYFSIA